MADMKRVVFKLLLAVSVLALSGSCIPVTDTTTDFPWFTYEAGDAVVIDVEAATNNHGSWDSSDPHSFEYTHEDCNLVFNIQMVGHNSAAPPLEMLPDPPVTITNELRSSTGTAEFFFVPVIDEESEWLHVHLFLNEEWPELVHGNTKVFTLPPLEEREMGIDATEQIEFQMHDGQHSHLPVVFHSPKSLERCLSDFSMLITNIDAPYDEATRLAQRVNLEPGEVAILITVRHQ